MDDDALDELKKQRKDQLSDQQSAEDLQNAQEQQEQQMRQQLKQIASQILTKEARSRLGNIRAAKPDLASQIEMQLVQLYRAGQIRDRITDQQLKELLKGIKDSDQERDIKYSRPGD